MAKIIINYDTKEKSLDVSMDGQKLNNISNIYIYNYEMEGEDESHIEITSVEGDEENSIYRRSCIYANRQEVSTILKPFNSSNIENLGKKLAESMKVII